MTKNADVLSSDAAQLTIVGKGFDAAVTTKNVVGFKERKRGS